MVSGFPKRPTGMQYSSIPRQTAFANVFADFYQEQKNVTGERRSGNDGGWLALLENDRDPEPESGGPGEYGRPQEVEW
jgi:hypothetical protein